VKNKKGSFLGLFEAVYAQDGLSDRIKELVLVKVAFGLQSHYCLTLHKAFALERGVTNEEIKALREEDDFRQFPAAERVVLRYADAYVKDARQIPDRLYAELKSHYAEGEIVRISLLISLALLAITWPFMLLVAMAIVMESGGRGPVFYKQVRVGQHWKLFHVIKFRSMRVDAEKGGAQWATKNDSRVTRVGAFIRKVRLDELPQIFNVLRGDMSFVGPRPERPEFVTQLSEQIPYYSERHRVKPGITGWAQVCYPYGASEKDSMEKLQYDLYYIKNYSLFLDLVIILQTAHEVTWGKGGR